MCFPYLKSPKGFPLHQSNPTLQRALQGFAQPFLPAPSLSSSLVAHESQSNPFPDSNTLAPFSRIVFFFSLSLFWSIPLLGCLLHIIPTSHTQSRLLVLFLSALFISVSPKLGIESGMQKNSRKCC